MKNIIIWLGILLIGVFGMAYLYFSALNENHDSSDASLNTIANNSALVFTFDNDKSFYDILGSENLLNDILGPEKQKLLQNIYAELVATPKINELFSGQKIYVGFVANKNKGIDFLIATQAPKNDINESFLTKLERVKAERKEKYYQLHFADSSSCYLKVKDQLILLSSGTEAIELIKEENTKSSELTKFIKQNTRFSKNNLANLYIDFNQLPTLLKPILNTNLSGELAVLNKQNTYVALNYNYSSEKLLFNGYTNLNDSKNYFHLFLKEQEQKITIDQLLPEKTANYTIYTINNYADWQIDLHKWLEDSKKIKEAKAQIKQINEKYRIDLNQAFPKYFEKQFATFQLQSGEKLGIISIKNGDKLNQLLLDLSSEYGEDIRIFKEKNILYNSFGEPFKKFERPFYTIVNNHFVVANNASTIQSFLNAYNNDKLLTETQDYSNFKDQISNSATILIYANNKNSAGIFSRNLKNSYYRQYRSTEGFKNYNAFGYQLSSDNGKFMTNILLLKNREKLPPDSLTN